MTAMYAPAMLLAAALLVLPNPSRRLQGSGLRSVGRVPILVTVVLGGAAAVVLLPPTTLVAAAVAVAVLAVRRRQSVRRRSASREADVLVAALESLVAELRIGAHPVRAFDVAAEESTGQVRTALSGVASRARLGADVVSGLIDAARRSALGPEWKRIAVAWQMAAEHGMPIGAVMRGAQLDIVERQRFRSRIHADMAGARASAGILGALPVAGIALGQLIGADPVAFLNGGRGGWCLVAGVVLLGAGLLWADRITAGVAG